MKNLPETTSNFDSYIAAVQALLVVANDRTGGSKAAALVLLSAYNSDVYSLPITELCSLDDKNYVHAMRVISARYNGIEPHELIGGGDKIFDQLQIQKGYINYQ